MLTFANVLGARRRRWILPAVLGICILLVLGMVGLWLCAPIPEGTQAGGLNLSGMWAMDAGRALKEALGQTLYAQPLTVQLPEETLTLVPEDCGVTVRITGVLREARKQGGEISLRPYLKVKENEIRGLLEDYAARHDTEYQNSEWHLEGAAPELATDRFDPAAPGQTLVVTVGVPSAHLDVDGVYEAVLDAYAQAIPLFRSGNYSIEPQVIPETVPEQIDPETLYREVYAEPVNDAPDWETYGVKPGAYGQCVTKTRLNQELSKAQYGEIVAIPLEYTAPKVMGQDALFQDTLGACETKHNTNENRNNNLRLLCQALDGYVLQPGETFSYNQVVGERTKERGYLPAPAYSGNRLTDSIGGGVCQGSTTLYNCVLLADLEVVFRACHGAKVTYVPPGLDASVNWLTTDFQFRNQYHFPVKIQAEVTDGYVKMKLLGTDEKDYYVKMETRSGEDDLAVYARSYKCKYDKKTDELISRDIEAYSTYYKNIG